MSGQNNWFPESAFDNDREQTSAVALQSQQKAVAYLRTMLIDHDGVLVLLGAHQSGKSTIVRQFITGLRSDIAVATVDGTGLAPRKLLSAALLGFGYQMDSESANDLLRMLSIFVVQQTRACQAPVLIVENIENMLPAALRTLCLISTFAHEGKFATRLVLTSSLDALPLLDSKGMSVIAKRIESVYEVEPITRPESTVYLQGRLIASGITQPDTILPPNVCDKIYDGSDGLPGKLNEVALRTLEQSMNFPASEDDVEKQEEIRKMEHATPRLILTLDGETIEEFIFKESKVTIGRSSLADIVIHNEFASKFHVLLLRQPDSLVLVDLNSANGTFVNSVRVHSTLLKTDDIVSLATYRIKILDAPEPESVRRLGTQQDTTRMKTLHDLREQRKMKFSDVRRKLSL